MDFAIISYLGRKKLYSKLKSKGIIKMRPLFDKEASIQRDFYGRSIISSASGNNLIYSLLDKKKTSNDCSNRNDRDGNSKYMYVI